MIDFIPNEEALALKELGFDEPCFGYWNIDPYLPKPTFNLVKPFDHEWCIPAPLYQQAFRWFREKYEIFSCIMTEYSYGGHVSAYHINGKRQSSISKGDFATYEEAEFACLRKLIEIVKNK